MPGSIPFSCAAIQSPLSLRTAPMSMLSRDVDAQTAREVVPMIPVEPVHTPKRSLGQLKVLKVVSNARTA
ncbi:hypothetical protein ACRE_032390 [Hapsidospora chrysogenum ATCC 11550]|uniref:Uncharacterized protein n=1 Tax=Hapsidospora chrysogenum (strain ATCC 11550 / CBS 779.69 / DSM 880 / IAM 14645 / JCM 23072 / IMI 49137) TaxID=857340 RepID=A0A086T9C3_HAPC1|nr:hypothetical protein ACRE_032390 [Hapsidospora chrysogenum ATCC 11550]